MRIACENTEEIVKEMFWLAWQACGQPLGMGIFQDNPNATRDTVWENVMTQGDYAWRPRAINEKINEIHGDYVFGRMMKLFIKLGKDFVELSDGTPTLAYQAWCNQYKTYEDLYNAAVKSLAITEKMTKEE